MTSVNKEAPEMAADHPDTGDEASSGRLLKMLGLNRPELRAWAMYDWANSAMACVIVTAVFPTYFSQVACSGQPPHVASGRLAAATTIGMVIVALMSPILGAYADHTARKKPLLGVFLGVGLASTAAMYFIHSGDWVFAAILFILSNIGANASFVFYDSLLPHIAKEDEIDRVSTSGYALGYIGGGLLLGLNLAWIVRPDLFGLPSGPNLTADQQTLPARLAFVSVAVWWLVFSIPLFRRVPEPPVSGGDRWGHLHPVRATFARLAATAHDLRRFRQGVLMLVAFLIYNDGVGTIMRMAVVYGDELRIDKNVMIASILLVQFVGIPCSFVFGWMAGSLGVKRSILLGLAVYTAICIIGYRMQTGTDFLLLSILVGLVQGGTQALSRSLFASLIPRSKSGEFFGFFAVAEKFAGVFGPAMFWAVNSAMGSSRGAILGVIGFFIVGGLLLTRVDVEQGQRLAREWDLKESTEPAAASIPSA